MKPARSACWPVPPSPLEVDRPPPPKIDHRTIAPVVERHYGRPVEVVSSQAAPIREASLGLSAGLFRVTGLVSDAGAWSVVLKVSARSARRSSRASPNRTAP